MRAGDKALRASPHIATYLAPLQRTLPTSTPAPVPSPCYPSPTRASHHKSLSGQQHSAARSTQSLQQLEATRRAAQASACGRKPDLCITPPPSHAPRHGDPYIACAACTSQGPWHTRCPALPCPVSTCTAGTVHAVLPQVNKRAKIHRSSATHTHSSCPASPAKEAHAASCANTLRTEQGLQVHLCYMAHNCACPAKLASRTLLRPCMDTSGSHNRLKRAPCLTHQLAWSWLAAEAEAQGPHRVP